jgi:hypothetical protein
MPVRFWRSKPIFSKAVEQADTLGKYWLALSKTPRVEGGKG